MYHLCLQLWVSADFDTISAAVQDVFPYRVRFPRSPSTYWSFHVSPQPSLHYTPLILSSAWVWSCLNYTTQCMYMLYTNHSTYPSKSRAYAYRIQLRGRQRALCAESTPDRGLHLRAVHTERLCARGDTRRLVVRKGGRHSLTPHTPVSHTCLQYARTSSRLPLTLDCTQFSTTTHCFTRLLFLPATSLYTCWPFTRTWLDSLHFLHSCSLGGFGVAPDGEK